MKKITLALILFLLGTTVYSSDLFTDGKPADYVKDSALDPNSTAGGYAIYKGDGGWKVGSVTSTLSGTLGNAEASNLGTVSIYQSEPNGDWFASLRFTVALSNISGNTYILGSPCSGTHIVAINKSEGRNDNCLTIDAVSFQSGTKNTTLFEVLITQTRTGGRRYVSALRLNAELLGFRETAPNDWNLEDTLRASPSRKVFIEKLKQWAALLQDASDKALDFSKPQNAFENVPSYRTLLSVPSDLADGSFSQQFIGAVESTRFKPTYRAIAFTKIGPGRTKWRNEYGMANQEIANKEALDGCEKGRGPSTEPCKLYDLDAKINTVSPRNSEVTQTNPSPIEQGKDRPLESRLQDLKSLFDKGLIDKETYKQKRQEILKDL